MLLRQERHMQTLTYLTYQFTTRIRVESTMLLPILTVFMGVADLVIYPELIL